MTKASVTSSGVMITPPAFTIFGALNPGILSRFDGCEDCADGVGVVAGVKGAATGLSREEFGARQTSGSLP